MDAKKDIKRELADLAPKLLQLKENESRRGLQVPPGYFEQLPDQIMQQLKQEKGIGTSERSSLFRSISRRLHYLPAAAAALLLLVVVVAILKPVFFSGQSDLASLSTEEIDQYIYNHIDEFDLGLLIESEEDPELWLSPQDYLFEDLPTEERIIDELLDEISWEELL